MVDILAESMAETLAEPVIADGVTALAGKASGLFFCDTAGGAALLRFHSFAAGVVTVLAGNGSAFVGRASAIAPALAVDRPALLDRSPSPGALEQRGTLRLGGDRVGRTDLAEALVHQHAADGDVVVAEGIEAPRILHRVRRGRRGVAGGARDDHDQRLCVGLCGGRRALVRRLVRGLLHRA
jgi:hypothetical protein